MGHILLIDADPDVRAALDRVLSEEGHTLAWSSCAVAGIEATRHDPPDVVLLERVLPDLSGAAVLGALRKVERTRQLPVVFLTDRNTEAERILGFELGASDYVTKPFSPREVALRVRAILRRRAMVARKGTIDVGHLRIDPTAFRVWIDGKEVELTLVEFRLLLALCANPERTRSRPELLEDAWGTSVQITMRTVDVHVARLRIKLGQVGEYVQTVRGVGYRFSVAADE